MTKQNTAQRKPNRSETRSPPKINTKNGISQVLAKGKHYLFLIRHVTHSQTRLKNGAVLVSDKTLDFLLIVKLG